VLTIDWNKYRPWVLASGGVDKMVKIWDCRMVQANLGGGGSESAVGGACETVLPGHEWAVRKVQWSPHRPDIVASASYDMTCRVWNTSAAIPLVYIHDPHTEFVVGCSWALYEEGVLSSCSWDQKMNVFRV
jgi:peroxin-7